MPADFAQRHGLSGPCSSAHARSRPPRVANSGAVSPKTRSGWGPLAAAARSVDPSRLSQAIDIRATTPCFPPTPRPAEPPPSTKQATTKQRHPPAPHPLAGKPHTRNDRGAGLPEPPRRPNPTVAPAGVRGARTPPPRSGSPPPTPTAPPSTPVTGGHPPHAARPVGPPPPR
ncbi:hypothetical protein BU14_2198s0001, partial [Porphyra umbilicalis]